MSDGRERHAGGGPESLHREIVIRGPFHGPELDYDSYLVGDPTYPTDSINVDNLFGLIQPRPGIDRLAEFREPDSLAPGEHAAHTKRPLGTARSLAFMQERSGISPVDTAGNLVGASKTAMSDILAVGHWYQMDVLAFEKYTAPPTGNWPGGNWSFPRYKIINLGGKATFTNGSTTVIPVAPANFGLSRLNGGFIRECTLSASPAGYTSLFPIDRVLLTGQILLSTPYTGPTSPAGGSNYAIFLPIIAASEAHVSGPFYQFGGDYCEIPFSNGGLRFSETATVQATTDLSPEFSTVRIVTSEVVAVSEPVGIAPGMCFRFISEVPEQPHGIVFVGPGFDDGFGTILRDILVWPPYSAPPPPNSPYEILERTRYFVTGYPGSTLVSAGANPVQAQSGLNFPNYVANCCVYFNDRIIIGTDKSYTDGFFGGLKATPYRSVGANSILADHHPGSVAWSGNGFPTDFNPVPATPGSLSTGAGIADMQIGPILWLFVMRDTCYAMSETGISELAKTGNFSLPFVARKLIHGKRFVTWAKPVVIEGNRAIILGIDDIFIFDGGSLRPIGASIRSFYRAKIAKSKPLMAPGHVFYEQGRGQVYIALGLGFGGSVSGTSDILVGDIAKDEWRIYRLMDFVGGFASWWNTLPQEPGLPQQLDTELLGHTIGVTSGLTGSLNDAIFAMRWSRSDDDAVSGPALGIAWSFLSPYITLGSDKDIKTVTRLRIIYIVTSTVTLPVTVSVVTESGQIVSQALDLAGPTLGIVARQDLPVAVSGFAFQVKIEQPGTTITSRPRIREIALTYIQRQELRQL